MHFTMVELSLNLFHMLSMTMEYWWDRSGWPILLIRRRENFRWIETE